jgi:thiamine kinase-like enzyme
MTNRWEHQQEVLGFLQAHFSARDWVISLPQGSGTETYFVRGNEHGYFVKVGGDVQRYLAMAEMGLTPALLASSQLESGASILVQPLITGRTPTRMDFQNEWKKVAAVVQKMHTGPRIRAALHPAHSDLHRDAGLQAFQHLHQKWESFEAFVPDVSALVDQALQELSSQIDQFSGAGLKACHNDICNANWLFAENGRIYLVDLESMSMEDPALDLGALLWWYYPPEQRGRFLELAGYPYDLEFRSRMRVRMALHCLSIGLPREQSFDEFNPHRFQEFLEDFKAVIEGRQNPQGYSA